MSRYDGNVGRGSERDYPFAVELPVPENGFGTPRLRFPRPGASQYGSELTSTRLAQPSGAMV